MDISCPKYWFACMDEHFKKQYALILINEGKISRVMLLCRNINPKLKSRKRHSCMHIYSFIV